MICKECNHSNEGAGKFCAECGAPLAAPAPPLTCSTCGAQYPAGTKFCPEDGTKLAPEELPPTCPTCGLTYPKGTKFCAEDGTPLGAAVSKPAAKPAQSSQPETKWQKCGDTDTKWHFDEAKGVLTISGSGAMEDYSDESKTPWRTHRESIKKVIIENGVTQIGKKAFSLKNLIDVTIPESVIKIGFIAFGNSNDLRKFNVKCKVPPKVGIDAGFTYKNELYVPEGSEKLYAEAEGWQKMQQPKYED